MNAMNYRAICMSNSMCIVLARLTLNAIQQPINKALSNTLPRSRCGYTTSQKPMKVVRELYEKLEGSYIGVLE